MSKEQYPYQNFSIENIEGEQWEDVPGLAGYFLISSLGRVKRLQYETQYRNGTIYVKPEKIIKPSIVRQPNKFKGDFTCFLACRVGLNGTRHNMMVARMVYYCFVQPFDLDDPGVVILCKDGDNFNIHPSNLVLASTSEKQQRTVERKRFRSPFNDLSQEDRLKQRQAIVKTVSKQVSQYTMKGRKIKTYTSTAEAERATGIFATSIGKVASGGDISAGGFIWRWGKAPRVDVTALKQQKRKTYVELYGQKVTQYDLTGRKIAHYPCIRDAAQAVGGNESAIYQVLLGRYKSYKGFFWAEGYRDDHIDLSGHKTGHEASAITQSKKVEQYTLDGVFLQTYQSVKDAAKAVGVNPGTMSAAANGKQHSCAGYKWKLA